MGLTFECVIPLFPASTVTLKEHIVHYYEHHVIICLSLLCVSSLKWVILGNSLHFNESSCYKYNHTGIDYIKLSASV